MSESNKTSRLIQPDSSGLDIYLRQINRIPLMSREVEREVAKRAQAGDQDALDHLVQANLRFVVSIAKKYAKQGIPIEDLINDGNLGLIKAAQRFDFERGYKFISYAVWWIRQAMLQSLSENSRIVRLPLNRANVLYRIGKATREYDPRTGQEPTPEEISEKIGVPLDEVIQTMRIANAHVSLDDKMSSEGDDKTFVEHLQDEEGVLPDEQVHRKMMSEDLQRALSTLTERERVVMELYFGLTGGEPITLEDIGKKLGLTRERIRQIKEKAIQRLRHQSRARYLEDYA